MTELIPHVLTRISGIPFETLSVLNAEASFNIARKIITCKGKLSTVGRQLAHALHKVVPTVSDKQARHTIIKLRRNVFNVREITNVQINLVIPFLPDTVKEEMNKYLEIQKDIQQLQAELDKTYVQELVASRSGLCRLIQADILQKGLLLSSQSLLKHGIARYLSSEEPLNKQALKTELSLLKYVTRTVTKTSPFSTFTQLAMGKIAPCVQEQHGHPILLYSPNKKNSPEIISHVRLNNILYQHFRGLMIKTPTIYRQLRLRPNPTLQQIDNHYLFLTNWNNVESFQRIPVSPILELFHFLTAQEKGGIVYHVLVQTIIENEYITATVEQLEAYANQLMECGFLEFNLGVSGIDSNWDIRLVAQLTSLDEQTPLIIYLINTLKNVRQLAHTYSCATLAQRRQILGDIYTRLQAISRRLVKATDSLLAEEAQPEEMTVGGNNWKEGGFFKHYISTQFILKTEQMIYEDTALSISPLLDKVAVGQFVQSLNGLLQAMTCFEGHQVEREKMRHFFQTKYGTDTVVGLLAFYEAYYREYKKPEAKKHKKEKEKRAGISSNKQKDGKIDESNISYSGLERLEAQKQNWLNQFTATIQTEIMPETHIVNLFWQHITHVIGTPCPSARVPNDIDINISLGAFIQFYIEKQENGEQKLMGVVNSTFPGYGKMFSRFLHLFDESITTDLRCWNQRFSNGHLYAEIQDASCFNANLHPPLMPLEIWIPGSHNNLPPDRQLPITELIVKLDEDGRQLQLIHQPTQKRVFTFDMGFQGRLGRSELFNLLAQFTGSEYLFLYPILKAINNSTLAQNKDNDQPIKIRPRIVYDDCIILQRQCWCISRTSLPFRNTQESDQSYFLRVNEWRIAQKIPDEAFIFLIDKFGQMDIDGEREQHWGRNDHKPQYICFKNPLCIFLFEKLLHKVSETLYIEEMLPKPEQLLRIDDNKHVTEFVIQWNTLRNNER